MICPPGRSLIFLQRANRDFSGQTWADSANLVSENMRLQQDLNTSVVESRNLAKQMQTWKEQLSVGAGSDFGLDDMMSADDVASPEVTRAKQEQAYRSVGALQLRVEELTMEVTKV